MTYKEAILKNIEIHDGIGERELLLKVMSIINPSKFDRKEFYSNLFDLCENKELLEVSVKIPIFEETRNYYFPKGSVLMVDSVITTKDF